MNCRSAESLFSAFIEDELSQEERRSLESHLLACRRCALSVKELRATLELCSTLPTFETDAHFEEDVMDRIRSGEALRPTLIEWLRETLTPERLRPAFLAGATVCAAWIAVLVVHPSATHDTPTPVATRTPAAGPGANGPEVVATAPAFPSTRPDVAPTRGTAAASRASTGATSPAVSDGGDFAWADREVRVRPAHADSTLPNGENRYQDEYILDQFYLNRGDQDGVHSIVPVSGQNTDDVYITF
ncbi:MAG TPA: zf-HC2 domain-containing protein [Candidatus Eisenbacteria bacterium]